MSEYKQEPLELTDLAEAREQRRVERIAGIKMNLGKLSLEELEQLSIICKARLSDAETDLMIVDDYLDRRRSQ